MVKGGFFMIKVNFNAHHFMGYVYHSFFPMLRFQSTFEAITLKTIEMIGCQFGTPACKSASAHASATPVCFAA